MYLRTKDPKWESKLGLLWQRQAKFFSSLHLAHHSAFSSLAEPAAMKVYCVCIRKELNSNRTSSWSPFDCLGTLTWRPWLHVERRLYLSKYVTMEARVKARQWELKLWVTWKGIKKGFASEKLCRQENKRCCTSVFDYTCSLSNVDIFLYFSLSLSSNWSSHFSLTRISKVKSGEK